MKVLKGKFCIVIGLLFFMTGTTQAATLSFEYSGNFSEGTLVGRGFSGNYSYDDQTNQLISFNQFFDGLVTSFTLSDFTSTTLSTINTFSLVSPSLEISFTPTSLEPLSSGSTHVHWSDWSKWKAIDYPLVPMIGDTLGAFNVSQIPEPSSIFLIGIGLTMFLRKKLWGQPA